MRNESCKGKYIAIGMRMLGLFNAMQGMKKLLAYIKPSKKIKV